MRLFKQSLVFEKNYSFFVNILVFVFPIVINSVKVAGDLVLFVLAVLGLCIAITERLSPFTIKELRMFSWITFSFFLVSVLSVVFSGKAFYLAHFLSRDLYFLLAPLVALAIYKAKINTRTLFLGIKLGILIAFIIISYEYFIQDILRPSGVMSQEKFGYIHLLLLFFVIVGSVLGNGAFKKFSYLCITAGFFVLIVNQTRGAWIAFIFMSLFFIYLLYKNQFLSGIMSSVSTIVVITLVLLFYKIDIVQDKVDLIKSEIVLWSDGNKIPTSIGLRLEMYESGVKAIENLPIMGYGLRNTNNVVAEISDYRMSPIIIGYNHLHNDYLIHLIAKGVPGLLSVLALLLLPLAVFMKRIPKNDSYRDTISIYCGISFCLGLSIMGLFSAIFGDVFMNAMYVFFVPILLQQSNNANIKSGDSI